jgi:hypothetical protein
MVLMVSRHLRKIYKLLAKIMNRRCCWLIFYKKYWVIQFIKTKGIEVEGKIKLLKIK